VMDAKSREEAEAEVCAGLHKKKDRAGSTNLI
jgi:hypothetical protein